MRTPSVETCAAGCNVCWTIMWDLVNVIVYPPHFSENVQVSIYMVNI